MSKLTKGDIINHLEYRFKGITIDSAIPLSCAEAFQDETGENATKHFVGTVYQGDGTDLLEGYGRKISLLPMTITGWEWMLNKEITANESSPDANPATDIPYGDMD